MARIALVTSSLRAGGAERVLAFLANAWAAAGHRVSLITLSPPDEPPFYALDARVTLLQLNQATGDEGTLLHKICRGIVRIWAVRRALKSQAPAGVLSFLDTINLTTLLATRGLPVAANVVVSERTDPAFHPLPRLYVWLRGKIYPWARAVVVQTASAAAYFPKSLRSQIHIIPNAVRPQKVAVTLGPGPVRNILSVGRLGLQKGHDVLISAFATLAADFPEAALTIYGEGLERLALETQIHALGLEGRVHLPGVIGDVEGVLQQADLFVFPSRYEGFPNALLEAMSLGLPVVAAACTGVRDVVEDGVNGLLVPVGDGTALAAALREVLQDAPLRQRLGLAARKVTETFRAARILGLWDAVLWPEQAE